MNINKINNVVNISNYNNAELLDLTSDIRNFIISSISRSGGHLASNLGMVEISTITHHIFNYDNSLIIFDTGHQCYIHKILTGRASKFDTLKQKDGIFGFPDPRESKYDVWSAGHSGTGLSAAIGFSLDKKNANKNIIVNIGDAALFNGIAMEALNSELLLKNKIIILLNDNGRSISESVGSFSKTISKLKTNKLLNYINKINYKIEEQNKSYLKLFKKVVIFFDYFQRKIIANYFISLGLEYIGIVDGHNIKEIKQAFLRAKNHRKSVIIHIKTIKGKGLNEKELNKIDQSHSFSLKKQSNNDFTWTVSQYVENECNNDKDNSVYVLTPAMAIGSKIINIKNKYPNKFIDTGISEEHTIIMSSALSQMGNFVYVFIYSTFLQRTYDQLLHDIGITKNKIILCIDRCGFQKDGITHHGIYDIGFLNSIPGIDIVAPSNKQNTIKLMDYAKKCKNTIAVRYPKKDYGIDNIQIKNINKPLWIDQFKNLNNSKTKYIIISHGNYFNLIYNYININKIKNVCLINALFIKPFDGDMVKKILKAKLTIKFVEETTKNSSLYYLFCAKNIHIKNKVVFYGYENKYYDYNYDDTNLIKSVFI